MSFREYEIRNKPLFASLKRAKAALSKTKKNACSIDDFFNFLESQYGDLVANVDYVTFYDFELYEDSIPYKIAYIYTLPDLETRDRLFVEREQITVATGWYPMISGKRANFTLLKNSKS